MKMISRIALVVMAAATMMCLSCTDKVDPEKDNNEGTEQTPPIDGEQNPDEGEQNPDEGGQNPDEGGQNPDEGGQNPDEGVETPANTNLAYRKPVTTNCTCNEAAAMNLTYEPNFYWQLAGTDHSVHYGIIDLEAEYKVNNFKVIMDNGAYATHVTVSLSTDGENFTVAKDVTGWAATEEAVEVPELAGWFMQTMNIDIEETGARYVKVEFSESSSPYAITIFQVEVLYKQ